jgi:hypothetical protein
VLGITHFTFLASFGFQYFLFDPGSFAARVVSRRKSAAYGASLHTFTMKNLPKLLSHFDSWPPLVLAPSVAHTVVVAIASGNVDHHDAGGNIRMSLILRPIRPKRPRSPLRKSRPKAGLLGWCRRSFPGKARDLRKEIQMDRAC